jgi:hypothetical protein
MNTYITQRKPVAVSIAAALLGIMAFGRSRLYPHVEATIGGCIDVGLAEKSTAISALFLKGARPVVTSSGCYDPEVNQQSVQLRIHDFDVEDAYDNSAVHFRWDRKTTMLIAISVERHTFLASGQRLLLQNEAKRFATNWAISLGIQENSWQISEAPACNNVTWAVHLRSGKMALLVMLDARSGQLVSAIVTNLDKQAAHKIQLPEPPVHWPTAKLTRKPP